MLSPRRAPNLGKVRRRSCLRLIPFPGTGGVLLAPTMISHPLAYVAPNPRHLAPTVGPSASSSGDLLWTGTLFLPGERSQPARQTELAPTRSMALRSPAQPAAWPNFSARFASPTNLHPTQARAAPRASSRASSINSTFLASLP